MKSTLTLADFLPPAEEFLAHGSRLRHGVFLYGKDRISRASQALTPVEERGTPIRLALAVPDGMPMRGRRVFWTDLRREAAARNAGTSVVDDLPDVYEVVSEERDLVGVLDIPELNHLTWVFVPVLIQQLEVGNIIAPSARREGLLQKWRGRSLGG